MGLDLGRDTYPLQRLSSLVFQACGASTPSLALWPTVCGCFSLGRYVWSTISWVSLSSPAPPPAFLPIEAAERAPVPLPLIGRASCAALAAAPSPPLRPLPFSFLSLHHKHLLFLLGLGFWLPPLVVDVSPDARLGRHALLRSATTPPSFGYNLPREPFSRSGRPTFGWTRTQGEPPSPHSLAHESYGTHPSWCLVQADHVVPQPV